MAIYELSLDNITESLLAAQQRNVHVRIFTDSDHLDWDAFEALRKGGVEVRGDKRSALMHNKFTIIDDKEVWTGSMNLTYYGAYRHNENLIQVNDTQVALNYTEEFSQLWSGVHNQANAADNYVMVGRIPVDIHFSPDDNFRETRLLPLLQQVTQSVHLMAFAFTSKDIAAELLRLKASGVEVKVVLDKGLSGQRSSRYEDLLAEQVDIRRDGNPYKLHHKVIIIDQRYVVTGSYNFSQNAESRNDENSLVIDDLAIARQFEAEFNKVYQQGL
jgi:phosphatidylserine/phosphatidylglycerophosphate/cardiolipin synthase-like enzyme